MRAIVQDVYGGAEVLRLEEVPRPTPGDDEVLVRVHAAGVDRGVWHLMTGLPYMVRLMGFGLRRPRNRVPGMDLAGRVEVVGRKVGELRPGDEVFGVCNGSFAEYARARQGKVVLKPVGLTFEQAAAVPVSALTALQGLRDVGRVQPGQSVLVTGAGGGVGSFAVQLARAFGAEVTGVCSTGKVELVRSLGADHVIDHTRADFSESGRRWDLILDIAGRRPIGRLRRALTPRGTLVIVGGEGGDRWTGGTHRQLRGLVLSPFVSQSLRSFVAVATAADLGTLGRLVDGGSVRPVVDRTYPLAEASEALRRLERGEARGKIVLTV